MNRTRSDSHYGPGSTIARLGIPILLTVATLACSPQPDRSATGPGKSPKEAPKQHPGDASSKALTLSDIQALGLTSAVAIYDPERAWNGYTLDLYKRGVPILFDMNGNIVHAWPGARVKSRVRLLPDDTLLGIGYGRTVEQYDWDGELVWQARLEGRFPHHDLIRLGNGNTVTLTRTRGVPTDAIVEIDPAGTVVWEWEASEHLAFYWADRKLNSKDITHINSVQEIPPNRWWDAGDRRFRPGNLLISARNLNAAFVIDKESKQIVWTYDIRLDRQHEAVMVEPGRPGHGNILIFNNASKNRYVTRRSIVLEIDPTTLSSVWQYGSDTFLSQTAGVQQALPNGNVMITSTLGRRIFEVTRGGETVWEWTPPFKVKRAIRYAYGFSPQLESMARPRETAVIGDPKYRHVDPPLYKYGRPRAIHKVKIGRTRYKVLRESTTCREVMIPADASLRVLFGLDKTQIERAGLGDYSARFRVSLRPFDEPQKIELLNETLSPARRKFQTRIIDLDDYSYQRSKLCLEADQYGLWRNPRIRTPHDRSDDGTEDELPGGLTEEELQVRREHLEALGYVD